MKLAISGQLLLTGFVTLANVGCIQLKRQQASTASKKSDKEIQVNTPTDDEKEKIARGLAYPYERLPYSFLLVGSETYQMTKFSSESLAESVIIDHDTETKVGDFLAKKGLPSASTAHRTAMIGYGSNAAPSALVSKFSLPKYAKTAVFPVIKATITDFDVVYSAAVGYYGTLQAALAYSPGSKVEVFITYLDADELKRMHDSEGVGKYYDVGTLRKSPGAKDLIVNEFGGHMDSVRLNSDLSGAYNYNGKAVAFKKVKGTHVLPTAEHPEVIQNILSKVAGTLVEHLSIEDYILKNLRWDDTAKEMSRIVRASCIPIELPGYDVQEGALPETEVCGKGRTQP